jgi:hypothetical protein
MVLSLVVDVLHYMFWPTWPSSSVYDVSLFIPEGKTDRQQGKARKQTRTQESGN